MKVHVLTPLTILKIQFPLQISFQFMVTVKTKHIFIVSEIYWQYAVISRPKKVFRTEPKQVAKEIVNAIRSQLGLYIIASDITYRRPNFIIYLNNSHLQRQVVAASPIRTRNFQIQIVPWSREHELTQLPWITGIITIQQYIITISPINFTGKF